MFNKHMLPKLGPKTPDFRKCCKNVPSMTNNSMKIVAWMSIWLATVEKNHIRTWRFPPICVHAVHEMYICFWFWKAPKNGPGVTNDSIETVAWMSIWLATVEKNHIRNNLNNNALLSNMRACGSWDVYLFLIFECTKKMYLVWQMIPFKLSLESAYDLPPWRETTSGLLWRTICFSPICGFSCGSQDFCLFL